MTVKELKEVLNGCNDDANVLLLGWDIGNIPLLDRNIYATPDGTEVIIDVDNCYNPDSERTGK